MVGPTWDLDGVDRGGRAQVLEVVRLEDFVEVDLLEVGQHTCLICYKGKLSLNLQ